MPPLPRTAVMTPRRFKPRIDSWLVTKTLCRFWTTGARWVNGTRATVGDQKGYAGSKLPGQDGLMTLVQLWLIKKAMPVLDHRGKMG